MRYALLLLLAGCASAARSDLLLHPDDPEWRQPAPPVGRLRFETTRGTFTIEVVRDWAPNGADRFYNLARLGYYDDCRFTRVVRGFITQFGLHGTPAVNAAWRGRTIPDDPPRGSNLRGTIAFAHTGPNTRVAQVYINMVDNTRLDAEFAVFGRVVEGMSVVDSLYSGYGENSGGGLRAGRQGPLESGGNAYIDREYPLLDRVLRVVVLR